MKDPEAGASAPEDGAFPREPAQPRDGTAGGPLPAAKPDPAAKPGAVTRAGADGAAERQGRPSPPRKRRKRRRGRKVFARDPAGSPVSAAPARDEQRLAEPAATPARDEGRLAEAAAARPEQPLAKAVVAPPRQHAGTTAGQAATIAAPSIASARSFAGQPDRPPLPIYAALDLGTNNCRLLVAVPGRPGQFRVVDAFSRIVRLGEGLAASGRLGQPAMDRAVEALKVCAEKLNSRRVRQARLIATEACRAASNGAEFLERVRLEAGLALEVIDRQTEARLAVSGCGSLIERETDGVVLFDIGGGSSEIALIDLSGRRTPRLANHIVSWTSLPVGVVSLAERFGGRDVTPAVFDAMVDEVCRLLSGFEGRERLAHLAAGKRFHLLGTSGTVTTLAGVHLGLDRYDRRKVDGLWMENDMVDRMIETLLGWGFEDRVANPCIGADRADLVLAGCAILEAIRRFWPSPRLRVADRGLREGILSELMAEDGVWRRNRRRGPRAP